MYHQKYKRYFSVIFFSPGGQFATLSMLHPYVKYIYKVLKNLCPIKKTNNLFPRWLREGGGWSYPVLESWAILAPKGNLSCQRGNMGISSNSWPCEGDEDVLMRCDVPYRCVEFGLHTYWVHFFYNNKKIIQILSAHRRYKDGHSLSASSRWYFCFILLQL